MKILSLTLSNFKGVRSFSLGAQGENVTIKGNNATGKTSCFDAFLWLLFSKDSQGKAKFDIKTLDANNEPVHGVDHEVEAVLEIGGKQLTLKKSFKEVWTQKRGSAEKQFTGHKTEHFVNDVPVKEKDYQAHIAEIAEENTFKLLTNPKHFNEQLRWEQRREIILQVCGDVSDADVISSYAESGSEEEAELLQGILSDRGIEDHKKIVKDRMKKVNDELKKIPVRVDEVTKGLPDIEGFDAEQAQEKIELLKGSIKKKEQALSRIDGGGEVAEKTKLLREAEGKLQEIKNAHTAAVQKKIDAKRGELNAYDSDAGSKISNLKKDMAYNTAKIESMEEQKQTLREQWKSWNAKTFEFEQTGVCPTCGQSLPEEQLEAARQKAEEAFNLKKAENLQRINGDGSRLKAETEKLTGENNRITAEIKQLEIQQRQEESKIATARKHIEALQTKAAKLPAEYQTKLMEKESLETAIADLKSGSKDEKAKLYEDIATLEGSVRDAERVIANIEGYKRGQERIGELETEQKKLAKEYAKLEHELFLTEEFTRAKVELLEEKINSKFKFARFKMFDVQINGGISETCETLYDGVPYSTGLNAGHQIIVGMDIINTLSEHYNFFPPIFVDNAEAVTDIPEMQAQVIRLVKPEIETEAERKKYSKLVVEAEKKLVKEAV